jgi:uncharacterized BrkB/YihY/UPF0761 family membrane protein
MSGRRNRGAGRQFVSVVASCARCTYAEFSKDRIPAIAAGATFFGLLALFPAITSIVSLYGLFFFEVLRWSAVFVIGALVFGLVYRVGPDRVDANSISWGSMIRRSARVSGRAGLQLVCAEFRQQ